MEPGDLGGDFGFEAEAVLAQVDAPQDVRAEHLVAGLHIGQVEVGDGVGQQGE